MEKLTSKATFTLFCYFQGWGVVGELPNALPRPQAAEYQLSSVTPVQTCVNLSLGIFTVGNAGSSLDPVVWGEKERESKSLL